MKWEEFCSMLDKQEHCQSNQRAQAPRHFLKAKSSHRKVNAMLTYLSFLGIIHLNYFSNK